MSQKKLRLEEVQKYFNRTESIELLASLEEKFPGLETNSLFKELLKFGVSRCNDEAAQIQYTKTLYKVIEQHLEKIK